MKFTLLFLSLLLSNFVFSQSSYTYYPNSGLPSLDKHFAVDDHSIWVVVSGNLHQYRKVDGSLIALWNESNSPLGGVQAVRINTDGKVYALGTSLCRFNPASLTWTDMNMRGGGKADIAFRDNGLVFPISYELKLGESFCQPLEIGHNNVHHGLDGNTYSNYGWGHYDYGTGCNTEQCNYKKIYNNTPQCLATSQIWYTSRFHIDTAGGKWHWPLWEYPDEPVIANHSYNFLSEEFYITDTIRIEGGSANLNILDLDKANRFWIESDEMLISRIGNQTKHHGELPNIEFPKGDGEGRLFGLNVTRDSILKFEAGTWSSFPLTTFDIPSPYGLDLVAEGIDRIWFADNDKFYFLEDSNFESIAPLQNAYFDWSASIFDNDLWIQQGDVVFRYANDQWQEFQFPNGIGSNHVIKKHELIDDNVWILFEPNDDYHSAQFVDDQWEVWGNSEAYFAAQGWGAIRLEFRNDSILKYTLSDTTINMIPNYSEAMNYQALISSSEDGLWILELGAGLNWFTPDALGLYFFDGDLEEWSERIDLGNSRTIGFANVDKNELSLIAGADQMKFYKFKKGELISEISLQSLPPDTGLHLIVKEYEVLSKRGNLIKINEGYTGNNPYAGGTCRTYRIILEGEEFQNMVISDFSSVLNTDLLRLTNNYFWIRQNDRLLTNIDFNFGKFVAGSFGNNCNSSGLYATWLGTGLSESDIEYLWSDGNSHPIRRDLLEGEYEVFSTTSNGLNSEENLSIDNSIEFYLNNEVITNNTTFPDFNGSITLQPTGGKAPYEYAWSNGSNDSLLIELAPGAYSLTVTDALDCEFEFQYFIEDDYVSSVSTFIEDEIKIYPNPFDKSIKIESAKEISELTIYSYQGVIIKRLRTNSFFIQNVQLDELTKGLYFIEFVIDGKQRRNKIVKL